MDQASREYGLRIPRGHLVLNAKPIADMYDLRGRVLPDVAGALSVNEQNFLQRCCGWAVNHCMRSALRCV